jgi:hypothetical protein
MLRRAIIVLALSLGAIATISSPAQAAPPSPVWSVTAFPYPTNFTPGSEGSESLGPAYHIHAVNIGGMATTGTFTVTDTLPSSVTPVLAAGGFGAFGFDLNPMACGRSGQVVTCTGSTPSIAPGEVLDVTIPVKLKSGGPKAYDNTATVSGGGGAPATATAHSTVSATPAAFGFLPGRSGLFSSATDAGGATVSLAGAHPAELNIGLAFPSELGVGSMVLATGGGIRDVRAVLPSGVVVNPQATAVRCTEAELESEPAVREGDIVGGCPAASQAGTVTITTSTNNEVHTALAPLYNMRAPQGSPGVFGFEVVGGVYVHLVGALRSDGAYELAAAANDTLAKVAVLAVQTSLWGNPTDESHDTVRGKCSTAQGRALGFTSCPVPRTNMALLSLPSACSGPLTTRVEADSWLQPGIFAERTAESTGLDGAPAGIEGCSDLHFDPTIDLEPDVRSSDSPSGLAVDLHIPQSEQFGERAESTLEGAKVALPAGFAINPSAANGRTACTASEIGLTTPVGQAQGMHFSATPAICPDAAKVGSVEVETPLLDHSLPGAVYLAQPYENPFGSLLAIYLAVFDPQTGVVVKLAGRVDADPQTGQLTTTFAENPQLPFEEFRLNFFGGPRAALRTPMTCGSYSSQSILTPWSGTAPVSLAGSLPIDQGANGGVCANAPAEEPNKPSFAAGTVNPLAGAYSPFVLHLNREDGSQQLGGLNVTLPPGLTGKLVGTPYCPDAALAGAEIKTGREEQATPSCPAASEVGRVTVGAGSGPAPFYASGRAYLAGPYKGDPLSLAIITPAVAGPYDLGTVVVRAALHVNPESAQISVRSDPLPTILKGIPLDVRSVAVEMSKPDFTLNPTNCEPLTVSAEAISVLGQAAPLSNRFQVGGCEHLPFGPKISLKLKGATKRTKFPALRATVTAKPGEANIAKAAVTLPHSAFLEQGHIGTICTRVQFVAEACPAKSVYGFARAWTPLLEKPLEGPVYLRSNGGERELPDLVAALHGQIDVDLVGYVDAVHARLRNRFNLVPDAPVSKFILEMKGGAKGLLVNSENLCAKGAKRRALVRLTAQNGKVDNFNPLVANSCKESKKSNRKH